MRTSRPTTTSIHRFRARAVALALAASAAVAALLPGSLPAAAAPVPGSGCGYGSGGPFADTLCWLDMSTYNDAQARSGSGQAMSVSLPGGYAVSFTVRTSGTRGIVPSPFPTWDYGAAIGKYIYLGTPGQPALYQGTGQGAASTTISLTDISVTDSGGNAVRGWRFVGADAESTANTESITFSSNVAVSTLATFSPPNVTNGCQLNVQQVDANTIRCTGGPVGDVYGTVLVSATEPSVFTQTMTVDNAVSREGVAFALQSSVVSLDAAVAKRVAPTDSFDVTVTSPEAQVVGTASTGTADAASTGDLVVLPRVDGSSYTMAVAGGAGTNLSAYQLAWTCTRDGVADPALSASGVTSIQVSPSAGEQVACTVTATGPDAPPPPPPPPPPPAPSSSTSTSTTTTTEPEVTTTTEVEATTTTVDEPQPGPTAVAPTPVAPAPSGNGSTALPRTGSSDPRPSVALGLVLLAAGGALTWTGRRRALARAS